MGDRDGRRSRPCPRRASGARRRSRFEGVGGGLQTPVKDTVSGFKRLCAGEFDHLPEQAFFMVGAIEDAQKKAEAMAAEAA
jgi:F-type H+-transporting ATPase subunit beta